MASSLAWRQRRNAVGKKLAPEVELLMDSEPLVMAKNHNASLESSPVSVAQMFNDFPPEMKSFILPGAWTVVGKGGRPLKNLKTYDPPKKPKKKKNKSSRKAVEGELHAALAEMPSSSKCMDKLERVAVKHEKDAMRGRDARYWAHYRRAKQDKIYALDALTATLGDDGMLGDEIEPGMIERPHPMAKTQRRNKGDRHAEKVRRNARFASQAAKCYSLEEMDIDHEEAMIRMAQWEAADALRSKEATQRPTRPPRKEGKAASGLRAWLPELKQLTSIVQAVLESEADDAESIEHDPKKRKEHQSPGRKTGKKSRLWREGKNAALAEGGRKSCIMM